MQTDLILASYIYLTTTYSFLMALWIFKWEKKCAFSHWGVIEVLHSCVGEKGQT